MVHYFVGMIKEIYDDKIIFECNNYGYFLEGVNLQTLPLQRMLKIYVYCYEKLTYRQYYGFVSQEMKIFFTNLIKVPNVGPYIALKLLKQLSLAKIRYAIINYDGKILQECHEVTIKIANNIINYFSKRWQVINTLKEHHNKAKLLANALLQLGFSQTVINDLVITNINWDLTVEEIVVKAIKILNNNSYY